MHKPGTVIHEFCKHHTGYWVCRERGVGTICVSLSVVTGDLLIDVTGGMLPSAPIEVIRDLLEQADAKEGS